MLGAARSCNRGVESVVVECCEEVDCRVDRGAFFFQSHQNGLSRI